jgi:alkyl sulfatase BDS1-like metallo-beta-lactamase superfamily hydrolase
MASRERATGARTGPIARVRWMTAAVTALAASIALAQTTTGPKPATEFTRSANAAVLAQLPFDDQRDFDNARRGFIARPETLTIRDASGRVVWDMESFKQYIGLDKAAPDTVNPSLWRNAQLNMQYGLFKVTDRIYQVRGYDLSNITFIRGDTGWLVFDPLISPETARAAFDLVTGQLGKRPIVAVVYSHSHVDHYGGVRGIVDEADVAAGRVRIIAPVGFIEDAVSENVIAGNAMARRAVYMYGALLPRNPQGSVNSGLGQTISGGMPTLIPPTQVIDHTGEELTIDGVRMVFQYTPGTEAPTEMNTWFPQFKALWMAENTTNTLHNLLTLRGAQVRDPLKWAYFINQAIDLYGGQAEVKFQAHHWPMWGNAEIVDYMKKQRDLYKYIHDQSVRLMNEGYTGEEISEMIELPPELGRAWYNRSYYGTVRHNSRAVYQRYMGWYDGNPSDLDNLPPEPAAKKYIDYMGGEAAVLGRARADYARGEYRWVAMVMKHAVFADPGNREAKELLADAYEQLAYQAESGPWRSIYLQGASELRNGVPEGAATISASPDTIRNLEAGTLFDYFAVRLNGPKAAGKRLALNMEFTDLGRTYSLVVENGVLNHFDRAVSDADANIVTTRAALDDLLLKRATAAQQVADGRMTIQGRPAAFGEFMALLDNYPFWFNIVTP